MKEEGRLRSQLKAVRTRLGLSQQELAAAAGITRQTIGGIEAGQYAPSAAVALRLAKALGCRVEDLFWLEEGLPPIEAVPAEPIPTDTPLRVTLGQVGGRWVAHPLQGEAAFRAEMVPADGTATRNAGHESLQVQPLDELEALTRTVLLAGCAPALSLWARSAERWYPGLRIHWMHANSMAALRGLERGEIHAAGVHLRDLQTGEDNTPFVRRMFPDRAVVLMNLGAWEEGLLVPFGNPKHLRGGADIAQDGMRLVNREEGAGARLLLDGLLQSEGIPPETVSGYGRIVGSHLDVAREVLAGRADVGVSAEPIAAAYGLGFVPLRQVRYDLVLLKEYLSCEPIQQLLDTLHHRWVKSQLKVLGGCDTSRTGDIVAAW